MKKSLGININRTNDDRIVPKVGIFSHLTSEIRMLPSFHIIGVQKGGTTSLAKYLEHHPQIIKAQRKDIFYFNNATNYSKGLSWYKAHFTLQINKWVYDRLNNTNVITFDATPNYFDEPTAPERLHNFNPQSKLIIMLRNPIDRAWSNYQMAKRFGFESLNFEGALEKEEERIQEAEKISKKNNTHNYVYQRLTYKKRGIYISYLKKWFELFPKENILVIKSEDFFSNPNNTYQLVLDFLNLPQYSNINFEVYNDGKYNEKMNPETRKKLANFYEPYNQQLYQFLNVNYGWN
jgi:hypothetical protein